MALKTFVTYIPLWIFDILVNTVAFLIGFVFLIPFGLFAIVTGGMKNITKISGLWNLCSNVPFGSRVFDLVVSLGAPYSGSISPRAKSLTATSAKVSITERPWLLNPFNSVHAVALTNLGELTTGLLVVSALEAVRGRGIVTKIETTYAKKARGVITAEATLPASFPRVPGNYDFVVDGVLKDSVGAQVAVVRVTWRLSIPESRK